MFKSINNRYRKLLAALQQQLLNVSAATLNHVMQCAATFELVSAAFDVFFMYSDIPWWMVRTNHTNEHTGMKTKQYHAHLMHYVLTYDYLEHVSH